MANLGGFDLSEFQGVVDWSKVAAAHLDFVYIRASYGQTAVDGQFEANWAGAGKIGLPRGAYHYLTPGEDAATQAHHFISTVDLSTAELLPAIDYEPLYRAGQPTLNPTPAELRLWIDTFQNAADLRPLIYTDRSLAESDLGTFGDYGLWIADPVNQANPTWPPAWSAAKIWQYSSVGTIDGITGDVDLDFANGSLPVISGGSKPGQKPDKTPPPAERQYTVKAGDTLSEIAQAMHVTTAALAAANGITNPDQIKVGQVLNIP